MKNFEKYPFVIGGIGGSGTRVFAEILQNAGCYIGSDRNKASDSLVFVPLYDKWIPKILEADISKNNEIELLDEIKQCVKAHRQDMVSDKMPWGWKNPRSIYLLKYFMKLYPDMKFIHVIRDGRDMAFSNNQNQVKMYARLILDQCELNQQSFKLSMRFWSHMNLSISNYCKNNFKENYLYIRFEDLCTDPESSIRKICRFCDLDIREIKNLSQLVITPDSIGNWKIKDKAQISALNDIGREALEYFGY